MVSLAVPTTVPGSSWKEKPHSPFSSAARLMRDKQTKKQTNTTTKPQLFYGPFNGERLIESVLVLLL